MRTLVDVEQYHFLQRDSVSSLHERLSKGDKIVCDLSDTPQNLDWFNGSNQERVVTQFEDGVKEKKEEYGTKTSRQKYLKNEDYKEFKEAIFVSLPSFPPFNKL